MYYEETVEFVRKHPDMSVDELADKLERWMYDQWVAISGFGDE